LRHYYPAKASDNIPLLDATPLSPGVEMLGGVMTISFGRDPVVSAHRKRRNLMLWTIIVILVVLWLLGFFGPRFSSAIPKTGNLVHTLIVIAVILLILHLLGVL
jgi:protein-S-isoprenylcysteine O-methyltransferase Ste14